MNMLKKIDQNKHGLVINYFTSFVLIFTIIMEFLIADCGFPTFIRYINDIFIVGIVFLMRFKFVNIFRKIRFSAFIYIIAGFILCLLFGDLLNLVPFQLVIWATRNTFRFIVYFLACVCFLECQDIEKLFSKLFILQIFNLIIGLYQYFILGLSRDTLGGIFGHGNGAGLDIFCSLLIAYYLNSFIYKKSSIYKLVFTIGSSLILAALAEEKFIFLATIIICAATLLLTRKFIRKVAVTILIAGGLIAGFNILKNMFPDQFEVFSSFQSLYNYATRTYSVGYVLPRIGSFPIISKMFFGNSILKNMFGLGFGNCETSAFSIFNSQFYQQFGYLNYRWFTDQWIFIECGYIGFYIFLLIFVSILIYLLINSRYVSDERRNLLNTGIIMTIISICTIWYNATLKVDMGYIAYFGIAIGLISIKEGVLKRDRS